ncbi:hypothetical protein [Actinacidiphila acididurans]|uniref:Uncharacterized protein n=1 Tax=Actinacidiphila acididurans TaxID=2784346 RepID=A0ABS2TUA5_9ACTN|nr:hypothetical protein [Actinacidiphila acididurans]MBM9506667.1 hypothetical protein [Actinacidiphila acididurans]
MEVDDVLFEGRDPALQPVDVGWCPEFGFGPDLYDLDNALSDYVLQYPGNPLGTLVEFLDPTVPFEGRGVCGDDPAIIGVRMAARASEAGSVLDFLRPSAESFLPNKKGTNIYGQILDDYLSTFAYP